MTLLALPATARGLCAEVARRLDAAAVGSPNAEARDLVAAVLGRPRFWPVLHADATLGEDTADAVLAAAEHRAAGMPFAYAVGRAAFRYLTLIVDRRVLIPRQETEYLVDLVLAATAARGVVADIGTGSGCIALALASEGRYESVIASDISSDCAAVAQLNARALADAPGDLRPCTNGLRPCTVDIRVGYLLDTVTPRDRVSAIVCNPPYIAEDEIADLPSSVRDWEPRQALCSAAQGLATTFEIVHEAAALLRGGGLLALECDSRRAQRVAQHVKGHGAYSDVGLHRDLTGRDRFVLAYAR